EPPCCPRCDPTHIRPLLQTREGRGWTLGKSLV
ncbi:uncharacterized protein METZ01_LOCUS420120, partial [marine metagenome]